LSPDPDDDDEDDDDDDDNNDADDDDQTSYATSPMNTTGGFVELSLPELSHNDTETFNSSAELTDRFYTE